MCDAALATSRRKCFIFNGPPVEQGVRADVPGEDAGVTALRSKFVSASCTSRQAGIRSPAINGGWYWSFGLAAVDRRWAGMN